MTRESWETRLAHGLANPAGFRMTLGQESTLTLMTFVGIQTCMSCGMPASILISSNRCRLARGPALPIHARLYRARVPGVSLGESMTATTEDSHVTFGYNRDYCDGDAQKTMTLTADDLIRRFLLNVLPPGFQRIHYYGSSAIATARRSSSNVAGCYQ